MTRHLQRGREGLQMEGTRALERSLADERRMGAPLVNRTFAGASVSSNSDGKVGRLPFIFDIFYLLRCIGRERCG